MFKNYKSIRAVISKLFCLMLIISLVQNQKNTETDKNDNQQDIQYETPKQILIGESVDINYQFPEELTEQNIEADLPVEFFHFKIEKIIPDQDLVILLIGRRDYTHSPTLYLSQVEKNPSGLSQNDLVCGELGIDICTINKDDIKAEEDYYLGIFCSADCQFSLKIKYEKENILYIGEQHVLNYGETDSEILKLVVPGQTGILDNEEKKNNILIKAYLLNPEDVSTGFQMYTQIGDYVQQIENEGYQSYDIWWNGQAIKISSRDQDSSWDPGFDQNFTIFIVAQKNSIISIQTEIYGEKRDISLQVGIRDLVEYDTIITYQLQLPSYFDNKSTNSLSFDLEPYYGVPELFVNFEDVPDNIQLSKWHITLDDDSEESDERDGIASLTISNQALKDIMNNQKSRSFFLSVRGVTTSSFKLLAYISDLSQRRLSFDCTESGYIKGTEKEDYILDLQGIRSTTVTIKLHTIKGYAGLYVKMCKSLKDNQNCILTLDDIQNRDDLQQKGELYYQEHDPQDHGSNSPHNQINFYYDTGLCHGTCQFSITVRATGKQTDEIHYRLLARKENSLINLKENEQHQSYLPIDEKEYYQFYIQPNDTSVQKIIIQVSSISGDSRSFVSRSYKYPDETIYDQQGLFQLETFEYDNMDGPITGGFYYIGIEAITATTYNIQVKLYRIGSNKGGCSTENCLISQETLLHLGVVQQGVLHYGQIEKFYFYSEEYPNFDHKTNIFIYFNAYDKITNEKIFAFFHPKTKIYHKDQNYSISEVALEQNYETSSFMYYELYTNVSGKGRYVVEISHDYNSSKNLIFKFSVAVESDDVWEVTPEVGYVNEIESGTRENYEIYIANPSQLYFELFECFGKFQIKASLTYEDLEKENYNDNENLLGTWRQDHHLIFSYNISQVGSFWFSILSKKDEGFQKISTSINESMYMVVSHVLAFNEKSPHDIFYPPTDTDAMKAEDIGDQSNRTYKFSFKSLQTEYFDTEQMPFEVTQYVYMLHVSDSESLLPFYSKCDLDNKDLHSFNLDNLDKTFHKRYLVQIPKLQNNYNEIIISELPKGVLHLQIMAVVYTKMSNYSDAQPFNFLYDVFKIEEKKILNSENQIIIQNSTNQQKKSLWEKAFESLALMIVGGILALICAGYWIIKYRSNRGLLPQQMEMSDAVNTKTDTERDAEADNQKNDKNNNNNPQYDIE